MVCAGAAGVGKAGGQQLKQGDPLSKGSMEAGLRLLDITATNLHQPSPLAHIYPSNTEMTTHKSFSERV